MKKFEQRFAGKDNAGIRAEIRKAVTIAKERCNEPGAYSVEQSVLNIAGWVALTGSGQFTLKEVAADYAVIFPAKNG